MGCVAICGDLDIAYLAARQSVLRTGVGIRRGVWRGPFVVGIEGAGRLSPFTTCVSSVKQRRVDARGVSDEGEGERDGGEERKEGSGKTHGDSVGVNTGSGPDRAGLAVGLGHVGSLQQLSYAYTKRRDHAAL